MNRSNILKRILLATPTIRSSLIPRTHLVASRPHSSQIQSITQSSFWKSLIPKPFRTRSKSSSPAKAKSKEWNPATFFIFIFLFIGSMSIQMIGLKNASAAFERRASAKIGLLKEIIERIQKGEEVDVEGLLGTGDARREKEWEEVLQEIEKEDQAWGDAQKRGPKKSKTTSSDKLIPKLEWESIKVAEEKPRSKAPRGYF